MGVNHLKICIVGGRNFGKTSLVISVARTSNFTSRNNHGDIIEMLADDYKVSNTSWNEIKDWQFNFDSGNGNRILSFADYPGEYFEKEYNTSGKDDGNKLSRYWANIKTWRKRRRVAQSLYNPDGIIILLPRDFGEKVGKEKKEDKYKRNIYEKRVLDYLEKVPKGIPIRIVISKWDLNDSIYKGEYKKPSDVVKSRAFKIFYERFLNWYKNCNEKEYDGGVRGISIMHHDEKDEKWVDLNNKSSEKPYNVLELFTDMSNASDEARTQALKKDWDGAKWWKRAFVMPWRSIAAYMRNSVDQNIKEILKKSWFFLSSVIMMIALAISISTVAVVSAREAFRLNDIESLIDSSSRELPKVTNNLLKEIDDKLKMRKWVHPLFFIPRLGRLCEDQLALNTNYVRYLEKDLEDQLENPRVKKVSCWDAGSDDRQGVVSQRLDIIRKQRARLPRERDSDVMLNILHHEERIAAELKRDSDFDDDIYNISKTNEYAKLRLLEKVRQKYHFMTSYRANDFNRIQSEIGELEKKFSGVLSNELVQIDKGNLKQDWSSNVRRTELKIKKIEKYIDEIFIIGSEMSKMWKKESEELENLKSQNGHYGPFDYEYGRLDKNDLNAIANFKNEYSSASYPQRKEEYKRLKEKECELLGLIMADVEREEKENADGQMLSMKERVSRAEKRTNAYRSAIAKIRKSDNEYGVLEKKEKDTAKWVSDHKKYVDFEKAQADVNSKPKLERVAASVKFLAKYNKEEYPEYANRISDILSDTRSLSKELVKECSDKMKVECKNSVGSWNVKVVNASNRIEKIKGYLSSILEEDRSKLNDLIEEEENLIVKLTRNGRFNDAFVVVKKASEYERLKKIMEFRNNFKEVDFPEHKGEYVELAKLESQMLREIREKYKGEVDQIRDVVNTNFMGRMQRSIAIRKANERALEFIPENHSSYLEYNHGKIKAALDAEKFKKWIDLREEANRLILSAKNLEGNDDEENLNSKKIFIKDVGTFFKSYPEKDYPEVELQDYYSKIKDFLAKTENAILKRYYDEKDKCIGSGDVVNSDAEKIENIKRHISIIDEFLSVFLRDSAPYMQLLETRKEKVDELGSSERNQLFKSDYAAVTRKLKEQKSANDKIDDIEKFEMKYASRDWGEISNVKDALNHLRKEKDNLRIQKNIESLEHEKKNLVRSRPSAEDDDTTKIIEHKKKCLDLKEKFERLKYHGICQSKIESSIQELDTEVKWVSVQVGDGSWSDISKKSEKYRKSPSRKNYEELMDAIKSFDKSKEGNSTHVKSVEEVKEKAQKDRCLAEKIGESKKIFVKEPNEATLNRLIIDITFFLNESYRDKDNKFRMDCYRFAELISKGWLNAKICLHGFDFKDTDYERKTDYAFTFSINGNDEWKIWDIHKDVWTKDDYYKGYPIEDIDFALKKNSNHGKLELEIKHDRWAFHSNNKFTLNMEKIIAFGIEGNGSRIVEIRLTRSSGRNKEPKYATVSFRFSGLPYLPDEEF